MRDLRAWSPQGLFRNTQFSFPLLGFPRQSSQGHGRWTSAPLPKAGGCAMECCRIRSSQGCKDNPS